VDSLGQVGLDDEQWAPFLGASNAVTLARCLWADPARGLALAISNETSADARIHRIGLLDLRKHLSLSERTGAGHLRFPPIVALSDARTLLVMQFVGREAAMIYDGSPTVLATFAELTRRRIVDPSGFRLSPVNNLLVLAPAGPHVAQFDGTSAEVDLTYDDERKVLRHAGEVVQLETRRRFQAVGVFPQRVPVREFALPSDYRRRVVLHQSPRAVCVGTMTWFPMDEREGPLPLSTAGTGQSPACVRLCPEGSAGSEESDDE